MSNKNVADYTDFDGKTNKKIVQAPGGASSMSLAWSNEKTDYGPERTYKKKETSGYAEQGKNYGLPQGTYGQHQNGYGPSQGYGQSQSYGQPQGYGQPPSYGSSNSYGQPQSYGKSQSSYEP